MSRVQQQKKQKNDILNKIGYTADMIFWYLKKPSFTQSYVDSIKAEVIPIYSRYYDPKSNLSDLNGILFELNLILQQVMNKYIDMLQPKKQQMKQPKGKQQQKKKQKRQQWEFV